MLIFWSGAFCCILAMIIAHIYITNIMKHLILLILQTNLLIKLKGPCTICIHYQPYVMSSGLCPSDPIVDL